MVEHPFPEPMFDQVLDGEQLFGQGVPNGCSPCVRGMPIGTVTPRLETLPMAAVIELHTGDRIPSAPRRPELRLLEGGRPSETSRPVVSPRTYLIRRIAAVTVAALVVLVVAQILGGVGRIVASELDAAPTASAQVHVVRAGETAWAIAGRYAPEMDRRQAVDQLLALNGQGMIRSGQTLRLPASFG